MPIRRRSLRRTDALPSSALGTRGSATAGQRNSAGDRDDRDSHDEADQQAWVRADPDVGHALP